MNSRFRCFRVLLALLLAGELLFAANVTLNRPYYIFPAQSLTGTTDSLAMGSIPQPPSKHTVQLTVAGSPSTCTYRLEGSLDGSLWSDLSGTQSCTASVMFHVVDKPVSWLRGNLLTLSGGSSPTVQFTYQGGQ